MTNSPGAVQAGRDVVINNQAPPLTQPIPFHEGIPTFAIIRVPIPGPSRGMITMRNDWAMLRKRHYYPFGVGNTKPLDIYVEDDNLYVDALITDAQGKVRAQIKKSGFVHDLPYEWDFNYNDNDLEIVDGEMVPVFRQKRRSRGEIEVCGIFYSPSSDGSVVFLNCGDREFEYPSSGNKGRKRSAR